MDDKRVSVLWLPTKEPRITVWAAVQFSPIRHRPTPCWRFTQHARWRAFRLYLRSRYSPHLDNGATLSPHPRTLTKWRALREVGRVERTRGMIEWYCDPKLPRQRPGGLNKGESAHKSKRAVFFHQRGEVRDRSFDSQAFRASGSISFSWRSFTGIRSTSPASSVLWRTKAGFPVVCSNTFRRSHGSISISQGFILGGPSHSDVHVFSTLP